MQRYRDQCKNTMHVATLILFDETILKRRRLIVADGLAPMRQWHGQQAARNRDPDALLKFYQQQAFGEKLEFLRKTVSIASDASKLEAMGFLCSANAVPDAVIEDGIEEHPLILEEVSIILRVRLPC